LVTSARRSRPINASWGRRTGTQSEAAEPASSLKALTFVR
jgi:hypothetical protein